ncbi:MAG TPA: signal peptidase I [Candidatus Methanoperedens sp.]|nr:signal peptidase I [Candidatus Methanoperedens sp.]
MSTRAKSLVREYVEAIVIAVALALVIRSFVVQAFKIPSGSMIPTLLIGDHLLVNKLVYRFRLPERGEVVVFKFPQDRKTDFIKRVVALPGDEIELADGRLLVNRAPVPDAHASYGPGHPTGRERFLQAFQVPKKGETVRLGGPNAELYRLLIANELKQRDRPVSVDVVDGRIRVDGAVVDSWQVADDYLFMMGDNRDNSFDSRFWGPVRRSDVVGKAMVIYWSFGNRIWQIRWNRIGDLIH